MKILRLSVVIVLIISFFVGGCASQNVQQAQTPSQPKAQKSSEYFKDKLENAKVIKIEEAIMSIGKHYDIYVENEKVAYIEGQWLTTFGNTFIMKDVNGKFLMKEEEVKRWGPFNVERLAEIKNENNEVVGYIGEKFFDKLFSIGWTFYFFDKDKKQVGISDQVNLTVFKENNFYDNSNKMAYKVEKPFNPFYDEYKLTVNDKSQIPLYQAIFMVGIEDAISDSRKKK